jgi:hypothetical protein
MYLPDKAFSSNTHAGNYFKEAITEVFLNFRDTSQAVPLNLIISFRYVILQGTEDVKQVSH